MVASAGILVIVAAPRMDSVAMRRMGRRICLHPAASEDGQREEGQGKAGSEKQRQLHKQLATAPP
jgi:hypothetical protein